MGWNAVRVGAHSQLKFRIWRHAARAPLIAGFFSLCFQGLLLHSQRTLVLHGAHGAQVTVFHEIFWKLARLLKASFQVFSARLWAGKDFSLPAVKILEMVYGNRH
jgi:hypothetical protein